MALNSLLYCADVLLSNYSFTHWVYFTRRLFNSN